MIGALLLAPAAGCGGTKKKGKKGAKKAQKK
jgi:hypothetical protein